MSQSMKDSQEQEIFTLKLKKMLLLEYGKNASFSNVLQFIHGKIYLYFRHILPDDLIDQAPSKESDNHKDWYENSLSNNQTIILYLHGNTASRAVSHRIELYQLLRKFNWHVFAFDYRGE